MPSKPIPSADKTPVSGKPNARLYLVRHGDTDLNSTSEGPERFRAWGDPPLNEKGFQSAHEAGAFLQDKGISHIFHSDLTRNTQTAQVIHAYTGAPMTPVRGLRPWNLGDLTGQPVEPNLKMVQEYQENTPSKPLPNGESFRDFQTRWHTTLHSLIQYSADQQKPIALVTHTRNLNELKHQVQGKKMEVKSMQPPGGIVRMDIHNGRVKLYDEDTKEGLQDEHKPQE